MTEKNNEIEIASPTTTTEMQNNNNPNVEEVYNDSHEGANKIDDEINKIIENNELAKYYDADRDTLIKIYEQTFKIPYDTMKEIYEIGIVLLVDRKNDDIFKNILREKCYDELYELHYEDVVTRSNAEAEAKKITSEETINELIKKTIEDNIEDDIETIYDGISTDAVHPSIAENYQRNRELVINTSDPNFSFIITYKEKKHYIEVIRDQVKTGITFPSKTPLTEYDEARNKKFAKFIMDCFKIDRSKSTELATEFQQNIVTEYSIAIKSLKERYDKFVEEQSIDKQIDKETDETDDDGNLIDKDGKILLNNHRKYCGLYVPDDYSIYPNKDSDKYGIYNMDKQICSTPCLVTGKGINLDGGDSYYILTFTDYDVGKKQIIVKQSDLLTIKGASGLIDKGIRVDHFSVGDLTKYYKEALDCNEGEMKKVNVVERTGWKKNNTLFAFGDKGFTKDGIIPIYEKGNPANPLQSKGSFNEWKKGVEPVLNLRTTRFKLYCAATAFILKLIGAKNIIVYHYTKSTSGKTTEIQAGLGCFGNPNDDGLTNAETTKVAAERIIHKYNHLPVFFDEASRTDKRLLTDLIFLFANGVTKARGKKDGGVDEGFSFSTVGFFTGEKPILTDDSFRGEWVRVFEINDLLPKSEYYREMMQDATIAMTDNYGFMTEPYLEKIFKNKDELKARYKEATTRIIADNPSDSEYAGRVAQYFGAVEIAGKMIEEVLQEHGFDAMDVESVINHYFNDKVKTNAMEEPYITMLNHFMDWFNVKKVTHFKSDGNDFSSVYGDMLGSVDNDYIDVSKKVLNDALKEHNKGDLPSILKEWKKLGIIIGNEGDRLTYNSSHGRVIRFVKSKINEVLELTDVNPNEIEITSNYSVPKKIKLDFNKN